MNGPYKIRVNIAARPGRANATYCLTVPHDLAERIGEGVQFVPVLTEDGLLYRPVSLPISAAAEPGWLARLSAAAPAETRKPA